MTLATAAAAWEKSAVVGERRRAQSAAEQETSNMEIMWAHMALDEIKSLHKTKQAAEKARDKHVAEWRGHCFPNDHTVKTVPVND